MIHGREVTRKKNIFTFYKLIFKETILTIKKKSNREYKYSLLFQLAPSVFKTLNSRVKKPMFLSIMQNIKLQSCAEIYV